MLAGKRKMIGKKKNYLRGFGQSGRLTASLARALLAVAVLGTPTACSTGPSDYVSYAVWNRNTEQEVQDCMVRSAADPPVMVSSCAAIDPLPRGAAGWGFGGATSMPDTGEKIPARVRVSWRLPPREGQELYRGDPVGPFELDINALVPANVRAAVRNSRRYQLELAFGIGLEPVTLRWRLLEWTEGMKSHREIRRGGDWAPTVSPVTSHELEQRECRRASLRVPMPLAVLDWVRDAGPKETVYSGYTHPVLENAAPDDPENAGNIWLTLREIDLDGDHYCDLVGIAKVALNSGGDADAFMVFWFSRANQWVRDGPTAVPTPVGVGPLLMELKAPANPEEMQRYGFGTYAPVRLADGRIVLAVRKLQGRAEKQTPPAQLIIYERSVNAMISLASVTKHAPDVEAMVTEECVERQSESSACLTWF